jgi:hypothetical protein
VIGVDGVEPKVPGVKFAGVYGKDPEGTLYGYEDEIEAVYFSAFENKDVAFYHKASKTLVEADLLFNLPAHEQYSKSKDRSVACVACLQVLKKCVTDCYFPHSGSSWVPGVGSLHPFSWVHRTAIGSLAKDVQANSAHAKAVNAWDFDTIIPCHGVRAAFISVLNVN